MTGGMDFQAARARVRGLVAAKKPQAAQKSALTPDDLRDNVIAEEEQHTERFRTVINESPRIDYEVTHVDADGKETKEQRAYDWTSWGELVRDAARANFGYDEPELVSPDKVRPSHQLNREVMAQYLHSDGFMSSRAYTKGNAMESLFGAMAAATDLRESAESRLAEHIARSEQMAEHEQDIADADAMMDQLRELAKQQHAAGGVQDGTKRDIKNTYKQRQAARDALAQLVQQQASSSMVADAIAAANSAAQAGEQAVDTINSIPGLGGGASKNMPPDKQLALAQKWATNERLRAIAKMVGRMYRDMRFKRKARVKNVPIEPVGVTVGDNLERILPMEAARAVSKDPLARFTFARDWSQGNLLEYEMRGKVPAGKGPCICVVDGSGSMGGNKIIWANSLALSVMTMMHREKRDFACVQFGSGPGQIKVWQFPKGVTPDPDEVIDMCSHLFGGGTTTVEGMATALQITEQVTAFKSADIILIADGQDYFAARDQQIRARLKERNVRVHGISIMAPNNAYMEEMCEYVEDVIDLAGANDTTSRVASNLT